MFQIAVWFLFLIKNSKMFLSWKHYSAFFCVSVRMASEFTFPFYRVGIEARPSRETKKPPELVVLRRRQKKHQPGEARGSEDPRRV